MSRKQPLIAALDPHRDDWSAAWLGLLLARLTGAPLLLASAYTVPHVEDAEARRDEALAGIEQVRRRLLDEAGPTVEVSSTVLADHSSPARALHTLAERKDAASAPGRRHRPADPRRALSRGGRHVRIQR
jgi:hypothetical protein